MRSLSANTEVTFQAESDNSNYISLESDPMKPPFGCAYFRVFCGSTGYITFSSAGRMIKIGRMSNKETKIVEFSGTNTSSLRPGSTSVTIQSMGNFMGMGGDLIAAKFHYNPNSYQIVSDKAGYGICMVSYTFTYDLYLMEFIVGNKPMPETIYVAAQEPIKHNTSSISLQPNTDSDKPTVYQIQMELDSNRPGKEVSANAPYYQFGTAQREIGYLIHTGDFIDVTCLNGSAINNGSKNIDIVDSVVFNNSSSGNLKYPAMNGIDVDTSQITSGYNEFRGPGNTVNLDSSGTRSRALGPQEILSVDSFGLPQNVTGTITVKYSTTVQMGTYLYEFDNDKKEYKQGTITAIGEGSNGVLHIQSYKPKIEKSQKKNA